MTKGVLRLLDTLFKSHQCSPFFKYIMKKTTDTIFKKVSLISQVALDSMVQDDHLTIIKKFTDGAIDIFEADFGFAWWKFHDNEKYKLAYKSLTTPYEPTYPRKNAGNDIARANKKPFFDSFVQKKNYMFDISLYLKSYIIVPIFYNDLIYGSLVLCYKKQHVFSPDELDLAVILGNTTAQTITIHRFNEKEYEALKKAELLKDTKRLLKEEKLKTEFIANATHELRTPIAIIKGNVDLALLKKNKKPKSPLSVFHAINTEISHISGIISDLTLIASRKIALKHRIISEDVDIKTLINKVVSRFNILAQQKNISLNTSGVTSVIIKGDRVYLEKMLANLVKNSIMYGRVNGHTKIKTVASKKSISIHIEDDGIGISREDLPHIFERFYRADKSHNSDGNSTGLGLAIVKWAAEIHGGKVSVKKLKKGTVFTVTLPM